MRPALCQCVRAEGALGQREILLVVGGLVGSKPVYLSFPESTPDQPDRLVSWAVVRAHRLHAWAPPEGGQRAAIWAECDYRGGDDMQCDHRPPNRLMYETAAVLSVGTNTCLLNSSGQNCRKARCTAKSSRQLMCQSSRGPIQSPEATCTSLFEFALLVEVPRGIAAKRDSADCTVTPTRNK